MKSKLKLVAVALLLTAALVSCKDEEEPRKGDPDLTHEGAQWNVAEVQYTLINQSTSGTINQTFKTGTKTNAGTFYFVEAGEKGSFEINIEGYNKEDAFNYSISNDELTIIEIEQSAGVKTNQNVLVMSGSINSETERTLAGTIMKQDVNGQFILEFEMVLEKK